MYPAPLRERCSEDALSGATAPVIGVSCTLLDANIAPDCRNGSAIIRCTMRGDVMRSGATASTDVIAPDHRFRGLAIHKVPARAAGKMTTSGTFATRRWSISRFVDGSTTMIHAHRVPVANNRCRHRGSIRSIAVLLSSRQASQNRMADPAAAAQEAMRGVNPDWSMNSVTAAAADPAASPVTDAGVIRIRQMTAILANDTACPRATMRAATTTDSKAATRASGSLSVVSAGVIL